MILPRQRIEASANKAKAKAEAIANRLQSSAKIATAAGKNIDAWRRNPEWERFKQQLAKNRANRTGQ